MTTFDNKRFLDLGQKLYIQWLSSASGLGEIPEAERREAFSLTAKIAFEAAEEFADIFRDQE